MIRLSEIIKIPAVASGEDEGIGLNGALEAPRAACRFSHGRELAILVEVRSDAGVQFGFVRGLGSTGCVLEVQTPPRLGSSLSIRFAGVEGSMDAPEARELEGYAQHAMLWRFGLEHRRVRRVAVKWLPPAQLS